MADIHCHFLPAIDDCSPNLETSLAELGKQMVLVDADLRKSVLLSGTLFQALVKTFRETYDYVIIDAALFGTCQ